MTQATTSPASPHNDEAKRDAQVVSDTPAEHAASPPASASIPQAAAPFDSDKRLKTYGEKKFNWYTYGGIALLGNEITSLGILHTIRREPNGTEGIARNLYTKFESAVGGIAKHFERFSKPGFLRYMGDYIGGMKALGHVPRLPYLLVATIGGMFMVPFVKMREDRKGDIVRQYDRDYYGARAESDPAIIAAHQEMDETPKQSWSSLWKGRITTVIAAAAADFTFGWPEALTTKVFKNSPTYQKFASLERMSAVVADNVSRLATRVFSLGEKGQEIWRKNTDRATWILALSSSLTILFYLSSKVFARRREERIERREHHPMPSQDSAQSDASDISLDRSQSAPKPDAKIHDASHQQTLTPTHALAV
jgi:hypothetical protein